MSNSKYHCRKATQADSAEKIAQYLHLTDPYIYPFICKNANDPSWISFIQHCMKTEGNLFHIDHLSVVLCNDEIVGVSCVIPCGKALSFLDSIEIPTPIQDSLRAVADGYFNPFLSDSMELSGYNIANICIDENHRGQGIGSLFMTHCIETYGTHPIHLDTIASNEPAIRLYQKFGFQITKEYLGFSGNDSLLPCYHMLYTKNTENNLF
ncbi:MAG: GNAT family N-acetyltransferase [Oscillospiraceae bacterium]|nr:GNAT family N-acetyltransferase [Oscillospiraceae bacterium]